MFDVGCVLRDVLNRGKSDEKPAGLFPALNPGLTAEAELLNGRYVVRTCMPANVHGMPM